MPNKELEQAVLNWVSVFTDLSHKPENFDSLADGVTLSEIMQKIEPTIFNMSKITLEAGDDRALRYTNLANLYEGLETYYTQVLHKLFDKHYVDLMKVSKNDESEQLYNLVELVLGATVQSPRKDTYFNAILGLDESSQNALMDLIEKNLHRCNPQPQKTTTEPDTSFGHTSGFGGMSANKEGLLKKMEELESENHNLNLKLSEKNMEIDEMKIQIDELRSEDRKKNEKIEKLLKEREDIQVKLTAQESLEELKNDLKLKDHKLEQMDQFIEEIKQNHQGELAKLEEEIDKQKKRVAQLTKIEATVEFYTQKYQDYTNLTRKVSDIEEELERNKEKIEELNKANESLQNKINTYKEKLEAEKTNNISLDIELTKRKTEIETLKSEKKRLEATNSELEDKVHEQNRAIEKHQMEYEDAMRNYSNTNKAMNQLAGQDFREIIGDLEKKNTESKSEVLETASATAATIEGEKEILQQENGILKNKCKEAQLENESLKRSKAEDDKLKEKLNNENNSLKEEIERLRQGAKSQGSTTNKVSGGDDDDIETLRDEINEKTRLIGQLSEQIVDLKNSSQKSKKFDDELNKKNEEIRELNDELEAMKSIMTEAGEQKDEELKVLVAAVQELAIRNMELEKQISSKADGPAPVIKPNHGVTPVSQAYKSRK